MSTSSYSTPSNVHRSTHLTQEHYQKMYERSLRDPKNFWSEAAQKFISWFKPWDEVHSGGFDNHDVAWFTNAKLNAAYNCLDRHLEKRAKQTALFWEGDDPKDTRTLTYAQLHEEVCRFSLVLKKLKIKKGDRVCIYMPMIPETVVAMLACARIGAIHSVVFGGFSADSLRNRIVDADCQIVITANESVRGGKNIPLKANVDEAVTKCPNVKIVIVVKRTDNEVEWKEDRDKWYHDLMKDVSGHCPAEMLDAQDPLFILYTSGSTGKPKGVLHTTGGYLVYAAMTHYYVFDYHEGDIFWCTADVGWVTGHTYSVYGPLLNGATIVMFEGVPHYPDFSRFWQIIDKYQVNIFYTAPTAIRALRREGDQWVTQTKRDSLKLLGSVGEPINPDVWQWYFDVVGNKRCGIVDTWWQTETGGILISPLPGATKQKAGSAGVPFFGVVPVIVDDQGKVVDANTMGKLVVTQPWPGMMKTIYKNRERFVETYFKDFPGKYFSGDNARQDEEGYFWITGRNDDVIKVSGHRLGTGEVENALLEESSVSEAAVVEVPNDIKGHSIYAFVTLKAGAKPNEDLKKKIISTVRRVIGPIATPDFIQWTDALPKTRSGKIMRRLLRKIANNDLEDLGDVSTLADPQVIDSLIANRIDYTSGK